MIQDEIHKKIINNCEKVCDWFASQKQGLIFPIYSSFDIRDSGWKVAPVDANLFPAGFNNICHVDKDAAPEILKKYLTQHYPKVQGELVLLTEEHTGNAFYWDNVFTLKQIIQQATGSAPLVCVPRELNASVEVTAASGNKIEVHGAKLVDNSITFNGKQVGLVICNNDFSNAQPDWIKGVNTPVNPPLELGWYNRKKHNFFKIYNQLAENFADIIEINPFLIRVQTELVSGFDAGYQDSVDELAARVDVFLKSLKEKYLAHGVKEEPFCFIKNNAGTYGLAVTQAHSGDEIRSWSGKERKKMKAAKGGRDVSELIIQEGISTRFREDSGGSAEPCIYLIGGELVGGFLRTHNDKGPSESLNSPGAVYKKLCMADLLMDQVDCPMENVYGWTSKLAALATAQEAREANIEFKGYI